ncbi:MAG: ABC transporter substrate-binding protein [Porticoccaceae bacterium]|nr:ABC transporter substrate-binding protein [Gammaproteobacteria bacterium]TAL02917.1 MAG: ABC transporter substrate-binding protein [Porticoccaceae bacterium]
MKYLLGLALGIFLASVAVASEEPAAIVRTTSDRLFELIDANRATYQVDPTPLQQEVRKNLLPNIDSLYSARLVLGQYGRGLPAEKVTAFSDALSDLLVRRYSEGLLKFKNRDQVEILPEQAGNTDRMTRVRTKVHLDSGSDAAVDYVFHKRDDRWWVFDVIIEGISYVATFRNQIGEEIRRDGFDKVLNRLQSGELQIEVKADDKPA